MDKPNEFVYLPSYITFHPEGEGEGEEAVSIYCVHGRPVTAYRASTAMAVPLLWELEYAKVGVVVITTQYGRTTSKLLATVLLIVI